MEKNLQKLNKKLILIDLDGTTLDKDYRTFNQLSAEVLVHLHRLGHKVCIATGRNYLSALPYYKKLGLKTLMATYNGAYINNPSKEELGKEPEISDFNHISNGIIRAILQEQIVKKNLLNALVDSVDREIICSENEDIYWKEVWFNSNQFTHTKDILKELGKRNALQLILEFTNQPKEINQVIATLRRNYNSSVYFDVVNKLKRDDKNPDSPVLIPDPQRLVIRVRSATADKGEAAQRLAAHYNISQPDTIAFGDSENDIRMIKEVGWGVAMANAETYLKTLGRDITKKKSYEGGVGNYLIDFFNLDWENQKKENFTGFKEKPFDKQKNNPDL